MNHGRACGATRAASFETAGNSRPPQMRSSASQNHCVRVLAGASVGCDGVRTAKGGCAGEIRKAHETCAAEIEDHRRLVWLVHFVPHPPHINIRLVEETNL
jgi:hypothetical protein